MNNPKVILKTQFIDESLTLRNITSKVILEDKEIGQHWNYKSKSDIARERWEILSKALLKPQKNCCRTRKLRGISVRRFNSFDLIKPTSTENFNKINSSWVEYSTEVFGRAYQIQICCPKQKLTPKELIGFNNTGNICIWPSEEVLAFYLLSNLHWFTGKKVLEVGGGMTCLAGLLLARYGNVNRIDLTDGNLLSVENVQRIIQKNQLDVNKVESFQLDWANHRQLTETYDLVLSSDCLFFDETRVDLVEAIWHFLKKDGTAIVMAPKRGNTLSCFVKIAGAKGFKCVLRSNYENTIWLKHLKFKESNPLYDENLHYPLLLLLRKPN